MNFLYVPVRRLKRRGRGYVESVTITAGVGRAILADALQRPDVDNDSQINPSLTRREMIGVFERSLHTRGDDEAIPPLIAKHILRIYRRRKW